MPSPFPGVDPFIEGQAWEDFHQGFIGELSAALVPLVRPKYVVRKERRIYVEHGANGDDRLLRADLAVTAEPREPPASGSSRSASTAPSPVLVHLPMPEQRREAFLTIREARTMEVVTLVELLSPGNKRPGSDGRRQYLSRREEVFQSSTHLVELDLLRGGQRLPTVDPLPPADFYALICRNRPRDQAEVHHWTLRASLPTIPVPLAGDDPEATIDLQPVFAATYDRAGYDYSLDYRQPVRPPLGEKEAAWVAGVLAGRDSG